MRGTRSVLFASRLWSGIDRLTGKLITWGVTSTSLKFVTKLLTRSCTGYSIGTPEREFAHSSEWKRGYFRQRGIEEVHKLRASSETAYGEITSLHSQLQSVVRTSELAALSDILAALNNSETEGTPEAGSSRIALVGVFTNICETS